MKTLEDPCRDPASEARDDHASEPMATPETDAESFSNPYQGELVKASFARRLERQRDEAREQLEPWQKLAASSEILRKKAESQRDGLLEALTVIRTVASYPHHPNALHAIQSIAKNTIAAVKGGRDV